MRCPLLGALGGGGAAAAVAAGNVEVVDLCGGPEGSEELVGKLRDKLSELAGVTLSEVRARQLLDKGSWNLDNATMAFFDSMD